MAASYGFQPYITQNTRRSIFPNSARLDVTDHDATLRLVREVQPKVIVRKAAVTNVDYCEAHMEEAVNVNVGGTRTLVAAARKTDRRVLQILTASVFDGA